MLDVIHDVTVFAGHHAFITKDIRIQLSASWWCHIASGGYAKGTTFDGWFLNEKRKEPLSFERKGGCGSLAGNTVVGFAKLLPDLPRSDSTEADTKDFERDCGHI